MKKITILLILLSGFGLFAQKKVAQKVQELMAQNAVFKPYSVLTSVSELPNTSSFNKVVSNATYAKLNTQGLTNLVANKDQYIEVAVPYLGSSVVVQLYKVNIFAEGFHVDTDKAKSIPYQKGVFYRGIVKGDLNSVVAFSFFNNQLNGIISNETVTNLVISKLDVKNNVSDYIIYSDNEIKIPNTFQCHVKESVLPTPTANKNNSQPQSAKCVTIYFEIDNSLYQSNGSDEAATSDWMTAVFNNVQTIYSNDGITVSLKSLYIWTTADPYEGIGTSSSDYLYKFNELRPVFDGDLGQLVGIDPGGLGGVAVGINGLCTQDNFSYSDVFFSYSAVPTFSWTIEVITHELGHLLGSPHTHGCYWNGNNTAIDGCGPTANSQYTEGSCDIGPVPSNSVKGTIMSYCHLVNGVGINFNNGFGPQPAARILDAIANSTCLSSDCLNTCINTVANIMATTTTSNSATITWTDLGGANNWQIAITPFGSTAVTWVPVSTNTYTAVALSPNTYYVVQVRPICDFGLTAPNEQTIVVTSTNYCTGIEITDTGGATGDYTDSETYVRTIIPNLPNKKISVTFAAFDLELDYDYMHVYDGNTTSAPDLSSGGFTGSTIPGPFQSTAADGSLTLKFTSDGGVVAPGYIANVACLTSLANSTFEPNIDFSYFPNPTNGLVTIVSKTTISEVKVYNVEGRLLYQNKANTLDTKIDMSAFANGTYFFKLKFNDKEANFKMVKMK